MAANVLATCRGRATSHLNTLNFGEQGSQVNFESQFDVLRSILAKITDGFFVVDRSWSIVMANEAAAQIASQSVEDVLGKNLWDVVPQYRGSNIQENYFEAMETGNPKVFSSYLQEVDAWVETRLYPSRDGLTSYFRTLSPAEVADLKKKTPERKPSSTGLKIVESSDRSERPTEFEQSAAIASHDLKEPLKSVALWLDLAGKDRGDGGHREEFLGKASESVKKCLAMVESLLENSRVATGDIAVEEVSAEHVLESVRENLSRLIVENEATIHFESLPTLKGNQTYLVRIFQNLISNSIKYHHPERKPVVRIGYQDRVEFHEFSVEDNGRGFESKDSKKIFQLYERGHPSSEVSGHGIGLAIVKKLVELHGGQVAIFSRAGEMTKVIFTIPKTISKKL
jgi:PAS domain S-box-containing protein